MRVLIEEIRYIHVGYKNSIDPVDTIMYVYMLHVTCEIHIVYVHVGYKNNICPVDTYYVHVHCTCGIYNIYFYFYVVDILYQLHKNKSI